MASELLLVGSIPLDTAEQVSPRVRPAARVLSRHMPDGEVGVRRYWIDGIACLVLNLHPEIETLRRPRPMQVASRAGGRWVCATNFSSASNRASPRCDLAIPDSGSAIRRRRLARISCFIRCKGRE